MTKWTQSNGQQCQEQLQWQQKVNWVEHYFHYFSFSDIMKLTKVGRTLSWNSTKNLHTLTVWLLCNRISVFDFCKCFTLLILNLIVSNKLGQKQQNTGKVVECSKNTSLECSTGKQVKNSITHCWKWDATNTMADADGWEKNKMAESSESNSAAERVVWTQSNLKSPVWK